MNNEEKKAIEFIKRELEDEKKQRNDYQSLTGLYGNLEIEILLNLIEKQQKEIVYNKCLYENKKRDFMKLQAFYEKDYIREIINQLEKEDEENRKNLAIGIELLSNKIIDKFSNKIMINLGICEFLENILKENKENG